MIDNGKLAECLTRIGLPHWPAALIPLIQKRFSSSAHGDFERWRTALDGLDACSGDAEKTRALLQSLSPWRKGPFDIGGVLIDAEWRSNLKWARLENAIQPLGGRNILDVGCGNGYYALRMRDAGAESVIGLDSALLYVMQFLAVNSFIRDPAVFVLPVRLEELPRKSATFDTTFSMGVLYHQRSPLEHLRQLRNTLRGGGQLVLETIFIPGDESYACTPAERYARMKNVWLLPTIAELTTWIGRSGFQDIDIIDTSVTSTHEQRRTPWMSFESLAEALDPADPTRTVEGWPAPRRIIVTACRPGT